MKAPMAMRAAVRVKGSICFSSDVPAPRPKAGQVLIRVMAAAINPVDYKLPKWIAGLVAGIDLAGIIEEVTAEN